MGCQSCSWAVSLDYRPIELLDKYKLSAIRLWSASDKATGDEVGSGAAVPTSWFGIRGSGREDRARCSMSAPDQFQRYRGSVQKAGSG